ncbi:MmcQ/YjbR family DNA-binding protein [Phenylobacterium sp.]|uniref:MmcQ/YjbR family DNA-binding protein n=1 Tax=Phenylobacterium sp. TaxID=1871053 RepID=UPI0025DFEBD9|nr:MmcQ/YjbR family DNA-binding protein [Phenylobacterium sp.]
MTEAEFRALCLALPGVEEGFNLGSAVFKANGKVLARLVGEAEAQLTGVGPDEIDHLVEAEPQAFHATRHLRDARYVAVRLAHARPDTVRSLLERRFREIAPRAVVNAWNAARTA